VNDATSEPDGVFSERPLRLKNLRKGHPKKEEKKGRRSLAAIEWQYTRPIP
jgi:hypothetical protein